MKKFMYATALALMTTGSFVMTSCSDDEPSVSQVTMGLNVSNSNIGDDLTVTGGTYTFTNVSTGVETAVDYAASTIAQLNDGLYNVSFIGTATYSYTESELQDGTLVEVTKTAEANIQGAQQNVEVKGGTMNLDLKVYVQNTGAEDGGDFVIAEIFSSGTLNPETNKQYNGDQYIRIYNNSDTVMYADGLVVAESDFTTVRKNDYTPDVMDEAFTTHAVFMVPGSGKEHPVEPGGEIIICDNAMNHKEANANSIDLSNADFEWYTESTSKSYPDVDNPDIPNVNMIYNYTKSIFVLTKQGNRAYILARFPEGLTSEQYLSDYVYTYTYTLNGSQTKGTQAYKIPNDWIIDAVNLSPKNTYVWNVTNSALDMGHTYLGENATVAENVGNAVVRKSSYTADDGRIVLQDTNNSSVDFTPATPATLFSK